MELCPEYDTKSVKYPGGTPYTYVRGGGGTCSITESFKGDAMRGQVFLGALG